MNNLNNPIFYPVLKAFLGWGIQKFWKKSSKCSFLKPFLLQDTLASWVWGLCNMNFSLILMTALVAVVPTLVSGRSCPIFYEEKCEEVPREVCEVSGTSSYRGIFFHPNQLPWHKPQASESLARWFMNCFVRLSLVKSAKSGRSLEGATLPVKIRPWWDIFQIISICWENSNSLSPDVFMF